jgi:hypothetical protein
MKIDRLIWGILLLFIGGVILLDNFNVINFYWSNVWKFWPVLLIIGGLNILFSKTNPRNGQIISLGVLVITLGFLFYKGQQPSKTTKHFRTFDDVETYLDDDNSDNKDTSSSTFNLSEPFVVADSLKKTVLNISGGGVAFKLDGDSEKLIEAHFKNKKAKYSLVSKNTDSATVLNFKMGDKKGKWDFGNDNNDVDFKLNKIPVWEVVMALGAGAADFDFEDYKVRSFRFDGGAAAVDLKVGSKLPITDVIVKSGMADIKIKVPNNSGCRIKTKTGLSAKDFSGFNKISDGVYETSNYATSKQKVFINLDGGLSNFEVERY